LGRAHFSSTFPPEYRTATTPPALEIVLVSEDCEEPEVLEDVVVVVFFTVVVVVARPESFDSDFGFAWGSTVAVVLVVDAADVTVVVLVDAAAASTRFPAVAPGRGSVLAGSAEAGDDGAPAEGLAGAASVGGDGGGTVVSGEGVGGSAT
jgi:hypothetical protein